MIKKYITSISISLLIFLAGISSVFAQTPITSPNPNKAARQAQAEQLRKERADQEIDRRIAALNELITRISGMKKLSDANKSSFVNQVQSEITNLTNLKSKIDADTDPQTLKTDKQSIIQSYRIFALFIPKIRILAAADRMDVTADKLSDLAQKLQGRIAQAQSDGKDVSSLQTALGNMQNKIADAKTQYQNAKNLVISLTPDGYPGNKTSLQSAQSMIKTGAQDLKSALQDARTIRDGLKAMGKLNKGSTSTAAP